MNDKLHAPQEHVAIGSSAPDPFTNYDGGERKNVYSILFEPMGNFDQIANL